ncbi:MAG: LacI family DNA-binding transcriptional regulator [Bifidobacteriaceae bacterium]|nr:LacI family DNA-binding transcriptional regulator [Bifidobacteriaceae bacterium]
MKDVAREAGVSVSSVSLVLSGRGAGRITTEVADRVRAAAADLRYVPNLVARGLRTRQTHTIGLLSDSVASTPFAGKMLAAAQLEAWESGYLLLLSDTADARDMEEPATQALLQRGVEGLIYASMYHREVALPDVPDHVPLVVLDGRPVGETLADWIVPDEQGGAELAVRALLDAGHRRIGFCNSVEPVPASAGREQGYRNAIATAGIAFDPSLVVHATTGTASAGRDSVRELLSRPDPPSTVFCFNDRIAVGAYHAAAELGLHVPEDLSIVGFDNQEFIADMLSPSLTTVELPHTHMGRWAARRIIERLQARNRPLPVTHEFAPCRLVSRASISRPRCGVSRQR